MAAKKNPTAKKAPAKKAPARKALDKKPAKRKAPSRPCVKCKKPVHPRAKKCPSCGADQPQAASKPRKPHKARKATAKAPATAKAGGDPWTRMVALKKEIDIMESKLASKKAEFSKLAGKL